MKTQYYPTCKFCGKQTIPTDEYHSQKDADEAATLACTCSQARDYKYQLDKEAEKAENLIRIKNEMNKVADYCQKRGMELNSSIWQHMIEICNNILNYEITKATIVINKFKITFKAGSKGGVNISYSYADQAKVEIQ